MMIQIIHIEGVRKGDVENFRQKTITVGRHPNCDVVFPKDSVYIARQHASISNIGGKYIFTNYGNNGSAVNGVHVDTAVLQNGDVITFSVDGPKVSCLFKNTQRELPTELPAGPSANHVAPDPQTINVDKNDKGEFTLQFANTIKSFYACSISLGQHPDNYFFIPHPTLADFHAKLVYLHGHYYINDLSQYPRIQINRMISAPDYILGKHDVITLTESGPEFCYLGEGKFAEHKPTN